MTAAGEHVGEGLAEIEVEVQTIVEAADIAASDLVHRWLGEDSPLLQTRISGGRGVTLEGINLVLEDYDPTGHVNVAQNRARINNEDASRSSLPSSREVREESRGPDPGTDATSGAIGTRTRKDVAAASAKGGTSKATGLAQTESMEALAECFVRDASVQVDVLQDVFGLRLAESKPNTQPAQEATVRRDVRASKKTKDKHSQTQPTTPTLYSVATQTDARPAPPYRFRASTQKKQLVVFILAYVLLVYLIITYVLVCCARDRYSRELIYGELRYL